MLFICEEWMVALDLAPLAIDARVASCNLAKQIAAYNVLGLNVRTTDCISSLNPPRKQLITSPTGKSTSLSKASKLFRYCSTVSSCFNFMRSARGLTNELAPTSKRICILPLGLFSNSWGASTKGGFSTPKPCLVTFPTSHTEKAIWEGLDILPPWLLGFPARTLIPLTNSFISAYHRSFASR
uniref:Uncharacterized protein n=1 Tax=Opuntia streptacantha TaxID=393608 RepID=A0A7C9ASL5_OPUST